MPLKISRILILLVILVVIIVAGAWRQLIFINTNAQLAFQGGMITHDSVVDSMSFLREWDIPKLIKFKWIMTVTFTVFFLLISMLTLWIVFQDKKVLLWMVAAYVVIFIVSGAFFLLGKIANDFQLGYTMSRQCMGALQSPFPLMMMIPGVYMLKNS